LPTTLKKNITESKKLFLINKKITTGMENSMEVPQKTKNKTAICLRDTTPMNIPGGK
jgi:hypothetical protein